jgi:hypothetical protein
VEHRPSLSPEFVALAEKEVERLDAEAVGLRAEADSLLTRANELVRRAVGLEGERQELEELLGRAPQLRIEFADEELRGQRLSAVAVELLARRRQLGPAIHYRDWFRLVIDSGHRVVGRNPLAVFLTEIARSPLVERAPEGEGVYRVDLEAAEARAERSLHEAETRVVAAERALGEQPEDAALRAQVTAARRRRTAAERRVGEVVTAANELRRQAFAEPRPA